MLKITNFALDAYFKKTRMCLQLNSARYTDFKFWNVYSKYVSVSYVMYALYLRGNSFLPNTSLWYEMTQKLQYVIIKKLDLTMHLNILVTWGVKI